MVLLGVNIRHEAWFLSHRKHNSEMLVLICSCSACSGTRVRHSLLQNSSTHSLWLLAAGWLRILPLLMRTLPAMLHPLCKRSTIQRPCPHGVHIHPSIPLHGYSGPWNSSLKTHKLASLVESSIFFLLSTISQRFIQEVFYVPMIH